MTGQAPDERPRRPVAPRKDWVWWVITLSGVLLGAVVAISGLLAVGVFVFINLGMNNWGSNK